jgi:excisionase family DNA binding protein
LEISVDVATHSPTSTVPTWGPQFSRFGDKQERDEIKYPRGGCATTAELCARFLQATRPRHSAGRSTTRRGKETIMDKLLTADQVAELLGMKTDWVWAQARAGRIPHVRLGRYRRFRESAVEAWLQDLEAHDSRRAVAATRAVSLRGQR